ncbi:hypothetical protein ARALYDRAFT_908581 [Arabidopsis lyrata subsp. lyrata]|uniref:Ubiquitin-like domain-containing protein n=1 Tax=Arabidopsis lyrata subsp. lyrata TaxID=81972 RepID=D7LZR3_ARALL|nr:hypothetical protein ARALYDRAFT_908581 [Arabidopsis lyrata subsp. lyrata]
MLHPGIQLAVYLYSGFTRKEFAIIKLTAQLVVRYGIYFWFTFFLGLVDAYERVLIPYRKLLVLHPCKEPVLEGFFKLLKGEKQDEDGLVEMAMIDSHAFVGGLDYFASREGGELSPPGRLSTQMQSGIPDAPATDDGLYPRYYPFTYPEGITRKQLGIIKLTAQFLVRYGYGFWLGLMKLVIGPSTIRIRVVVQDGDDGQLVEVTVQSLSESVASLKEKIAGEIQIPANKHKISGKTGVLEDNISLAHYNVGAGEILTLSM